MCALFTRCLVCLTPFEPNEELEYLPHGNRFAYDAGRGRLWVVCTHCRRWSLAPIEERWEALEELERVATDRAKLLSQTENIALLRAGPVDIVRVGRARLAEEAWWRYGQELTGRRQQFRKISLIGSATVGAVILGGWATGAVGFIGTWWLWRRAPGKIPDIARWFRFGSTAWRGQTRCLSCGHEYREIRFKDRKRLYLRADDAEGGVGLSGACPSCGATGRYGFRLQGAEGERAVRRILAYHHFSGASEQRVLAATKLIESAGSTRQFASSALGEGRRLGEFDRTGAIAVEIAANETLEQHLLESELAELEATWRAEEEIAAIADGELTPLPLLESLRRRVVGQHVRGEP